MFLKTYNTEFDDIIITFSDQNGRSLEIEDKVNLHCLLINRNDMFFYRTNNKKGYIKGYGFLSFTRNISYKYEKKLLNTTTKTGLDAAKTASKKIVHKTAEAIGKLIGNKVAKKIVKPKLMPEAN